MGENKSLLLKSSMSFGFMLGIFWAVKYAFYMFGTSSAIMNFIYMFLTALVPIVAYVMTRLYKVALGGKIGFFHAWQFGVLLYFFAALVVSLEHYAFYRYIAPPGFLENSINQTIELLKKAEVDEKMIEAVSNFRFTPIRMAIQGIFNNVFYGMFFSLPVAYVVSRTKMDVPPPFNMNEDNA